MLLRLILPLFILTVYFIDVYAEEDDDNSLFNYYSANNREAYKPDYNRYNTNRHNTHRHNRTNRYENPNRFDKLVDESGSNRGSENDVSVTSNEGHSEWTYKDQENWRDINKDCGGNSQSPIDIGPKITPKYRLKVDFEFGRQREATLKNTGHTAELSFEDGNGNVITARGSALNHDTYVFQQMHFHWGAYDNEGSEHGLGGQKFSAEVHFVFFNSKYRNFQTAAGYKDGITVFGMFLQASHQDNYNLAPITESLDQVTRANSKTTVRLDILKLFPRYKEKYYRYFGSLTTPPCSEVVNWIVFESPIKIGRSQLQKFRQLEDSKGNKLKTTWRFLQNRNGRSIESSKPR